MSLSLATPTSKQQISFVTGNQLREVLTPTAAVNALQAVLEAGLDPEMDAPRTRVNTDTGVFLQMPSTWNNYVGTKLLTITEGNSVIGAPVIQGIYAVFGGESQAPLAILDGIELTNLRTSAVSALGARLATSHGTKSLVVFGTGVQAWAHIVTFAHVFDLSEVTIVGRNHDSAQSLMNRAISELGLVAAVGTSDDVRKADFVVCCTASSVPLFDEALVSNHAVVVAMGAHEPASRELEAELLQRSNVIVESRDSALREAGDVIQALAEGAITNAAELMTLSEIVCKTRVLKNDRPTVFKSTGMPWEDLVLASSALEKLFNTSSHDEETSQRNEK